MNKHDYVDTIFNTNKNPLLQMTGSEGKYGSNRGSVIHGNNHNLEIQNQIIQEAVA